MLSGFTRLKECMQQPDEEMNNAHGVDRVLRDMLQPFPCFEITPTATSDRVSADEVTTLV